jgi:hypothetical protein
MILSFEFRVLCVRVNLQSCFRSCFNDCPVYALLLCMCYHYAVFLPVGSSLNELNRWSPSLDLDLSLWLLSMWWKIYKMCGSVSWISCCECSNSTTHNEHFVQLELPTRNPWQWTWYVDSHSATHNEQHARFPAAIPKSSVGKGQLVNIVIVLIQTEILSSIG